MRILFIIVLLWMEMALAENADKMVQQNILTVQIYTQRLFTSFEKREPLILNLFPDVEFSTVIKESLSLRERLF